MSQTAGTAIVDTFDLLLLGTIGLGTLAWFGRRKIMDAIFGVSSSASSPSGAKPATPKPKRERNFVKVMEQQSRRVIFFYGSQTGTAEDYAKRLAKECSQRYGVSCMTADLEMYDMSYLDTVPQDALIFFVLATYGEGEPTDNAVEFWDLITEDEPQFSNSETLAGLRYAVFSLGNKTYEHYNAVGRKVDQRLSALGAKKIGERGEGDDDGSLEEDFLAWQESMWPAFCEALGVDESSGRSGPRQPTWEVKELETFEEEDIYYGEIGERKKMEKRVIYDAKRPFIAPIQTRELFQESTLKEGARHYLHVDVDLSGTNLNYQTGDHIAMWPTNSEVEVNRLASILGLHDKLDAVVTVKAVDVTDSKANPFPVPTTYRSIFRHYIDICAPASRQTLMSLVEYAPPGAKEYLHKLATDKDEYRRHVAEAVRNVGEVLEKVAGDALYPGYFAAVPFDLIVESISRLNPRYYSISSSSKESSSTVSATCVTLDYSPVPNRRVFGVHTTFLWQIHSATHRLQHESAYPAYDLAGPRQSFLENNVCGKIPVHIRRSQFKLPRNAEVPVIMIGPGTGVAPFRGFVRERVVMKKEGKKVGPMLLFYGCRHPQQDFLYADEWPGLFKSLEEPSEIITAFSRETDHKVYVQHRLLERQKQVWEMLEKGAYIYVCGDAKNMARDVNETFANIAQEVGGKKAGEPHDYVKNLRNTGRYQEDVWS